MGSTQDSPFRCDAPQGMMCIARELTTPESGLDHVDLLGYSGAAFRIHTLPREVLCPSTVSPRFGCKPPALEQIPLDTATALRQAKTLAEPGEFGEYLSGTRAYDLWIQLLEAAEDSGLMKQQILAHSVDDAGLPVLNTYCFLSLLHAREAAGPFLRRRAAELHGEASRHVAEAAACYDRVVAVLQAAGKPAWNAEARKKQATAMREARDIEAQAAVLLGKAL